MQFNDLYCLARPEVHTLSIGAARPSDFDEHVAALKHYADAAGLIAPIEGRLRAAMCETLGEDWCASWFKGIPNYDQLPGMINVLEILRLWTYAQPLDIIGWAKMRYNLLGQAEHWFPGMNAETIQADELKRALTHSPFAEKIPEVLRCAHELFCEKPVKRLSQS